MSQIAITAGQAAAVWAVVSVPIGAALPWATKRVWVAATRKPNVEAVFGFQAGEQKLFVAPTMPSESLQRREFERMTTAFEGIYAYEELRSAFAGIRNQHDVCRILLSEGVRPDDLETNLVLIGGPNFNALSRDLLSTVASECGFIGHKAVFPSAGLEFETATQDDKSIRDYAILICKESPWPGGKRVFAVMGCRTFATMGVSRAIATREFQRKLGGSIRERKLGSWVACVSIVARRVQAQTIVYSAPHIEHLAPLEGTPIKRGA